MQNGIAHSVAVGRLEINLRTAKSVVDEPKTW